MHGFLKNCMVPLFVAQSEGQSIIYSEDFLEDLLFRFFEIISF